MTNAAPLHGLETEPATPSDEERFAAVLDRTVTTIERAGIDYAMIGGLGSATLGRPRWTRDIDILVAPADALRTLESLRGAGFETERTDEHWLYKAALDTVLVDVLFRTKGDIYLDDEMLEHVREGEVLGVRVRVASPEDQIVIKAIAHDEPSARHWNDALALIAGSAIDWDYLLHRARHGARRVLSLLVYAQSNDLVVPDTAIEDLHRTIYWGETDRDR